MNTFRHGTEETKKFGSPYCAGLVLIYVYCLFYQTEMMLCGMLLCFYTIRKNTLENNVALKGKSAKSKLWQMSNKY